MLSHFLRAAKQKEPPSFISSSINRANSVTTLTVTAPSGIQDNDLLVCFVYGSGVATVTLPTGFTNVYSETSANPRVNVGWKTAASESGNYVFTASGSANLSASILVYRSASYDVVGTITRPGSSTVSASSVTSTIPGILIAAFTSSSVSPTVTSAPSGMTQRAITTGSASAPSLVVYDEVIAVSGATGSRTLTWSAGTTTSGIQLFVG